MASVTSQQQIPSIPSETPRKEIDEMATNASDRFTDDIPDIVPIDAYNAEEVRHLIFT